MKVYKDFPLSTILWYKIGGIAKFLLDVKSKEDLQKALDFVKKNNFKKVFVIGSGSNLLFSDKYFDGAIIHISAEGKSVRVFDDFFLEAFAGETLDSVVQFSFKNNLAGLEWAGGLPGTVGAAVRGNVGAFGYEIKDVLEEAEAVDIRNGNGEIKKFKRKDIEFSYRDSLFKKNSNLIVVSSVFRLKKVTVGKIEEACQVYLSNIKYRKDNHPQEYPNCGSVFKNITEKEKVKKILEVYPDIEEKVKKSWHGKVSAGYLIKRLGMASFTIGNAQISQKHANFILNLGNAKFSDIISIITTIKSKFLETFGFVPEEEVEIVN